MEVLTAPNQVISQYQYIWKINVSVFSFELKLEKCFGVRTMYRFPLYTNPCNWPTKFAIVDVIWISSSAWNMPPKWMDRISMVLCRPRIVSAVEENQSKCMQNEISKTYSPYDMVFFCWSHWPLHWSCYFGELFVEKLINEKTDKKIVRVCDKLISNIWSLRLC